MAEPRPKIAITGVSGRMGRQIATLVRDDGRAALAAALERPGHVWIGKDLGTAYDGAAWGVAVQADLDTALAGVDAVIDFTTPAASVACAEAAARAGCAHVIGTTGFADADLVSLADAARHIAVVRAGNMSLGVNLLVGLTRQVAATLGADFDIEITEAHHRHKADAPSGTALMLGEAAAAGRGVTLSDVADRSRDGITGPRRPGAIGFSVVRGGDIVGEHEVLFAGAGERIALRHVASDRSVFARGALAAALWAAGQPAGAYDMSDVLGLA